MDLIWQGNRLLVPESGLHIGVIPPPPGLVNKLTDWTNTNFDTFSSSGIDINSAIELVGTNGKCQSNSTFITGAFPGSGGTVTFYYYLTVNSGSYPYVELYKNGVSQGQGAQGYDEPKEYVMSYLIYSSGNYSIGFTNQNTTPTNFTATNCRMYIQNGI